MNLKKVILCGGDIRSKYMAEFFLENGIDAKIHCIDNNVKNSLPESKNEDFKNADVIILGLPALKKDFTINAPMSNDSIRFESILKEISKNTVIAGGRFPETACKMAEKHGIKLFDYSTDEVFQIENAFYTAEGTVSEIIKNTQKSVTELSMLVIGFGRIAKALCTVVSGFGTGITVYARKEEQRTWACMQGFNTRDNLENLDRYNVVVNTVPHALLSEKELCTLKKDSLIIDLSARPGYVDAEMCKKQKIKLIFLPGLPATSAPRSAGEAAARAVIRMCNEI